MSKKSKGIIVLLVFLIIAIVVFLCCNYAKGFNVAETSNTTNYINESTNNKMESTVESKIENKTEINIGNSEVVEENTVKEEPVQEPEPVKEPDENIDNVQNEDSELQSNNDEEKAIAIVKKDWGDTAGVAFKVEQINGDGSYVISVRNEDSVAMEWYTVYPKTGKFTK